MQADRVQVLAQQAAAGNVEAFIALVQEFAPDLRLALAAHLDQPTALAAVESAVWSAVRSQLGEFIGDPPFASWIQSVAIEPVTAHLTQADRRAVDIQDALAHQNIQACHEALADGRELQVAQLRQRIAALPEATRALLTRRYRDRQRPSDIAANLMIGESELAISLATARAFCDWRELARPPAAGERLLPPLIEDWLNHTIDVDSRALLATNLGRDPERAAQFARQVRVHLALGACLAPFTREDAVALVRQTGLGAGDSGRVIMGEVPRSASPVRSPGSSARRPVRMTTSNRHVVPLTDEAPRPSPLPWIIGGVMVLVGALALLVMTLGAGTTRIAAPRPSEVAPAPTVVVPTSGSGSQQPVPPRFVGGDGSVLRPMPGAPSEPRVILVGAIAGTHVYIGKPFELRALVSGIPTLTEVEYWAGDQRLGTAREIPFNLKWTPSRVGAVTVQVRAMIGAVMKTQSEPMVLTVVQAFGSGQFTREWWGGLPGEQIADGMSALTATTPPSGRVLESQFAAPRDFEDSYLQRLSGYVIPPLDGEYVFWICSDDEGELWLSSDDTYEHRTRIALAPSAVRYQAWDHDTRQRSAPIRLRAGQRYYCEALHKEGMVHDHLDVGWQLPDGSLERPISGIHLTPAPPQPTPNGPPVAPLTTPPVVTTPTGATAIDTVRRPDLIIWDGDGANGGAGYKGFGAAGQSAFEEVADQGHGGAGLRARLGGGNAANVGWNWHSWSSDSAGTDLNGFAALTMWLRFSGPAAPQKVVMRLACSPRDPVRHTVDVNLIARQPGLLDGAWHQVIVPLAELVPQGQDFDRAKVWEVAFDISSTANMDGTFDVDEIGAVRSLTAPPPAAVVPWKVVRAINLGGEATEIDGVKFAGHRQAEADSATPVGSHQPGPRLSDLPWVRATNANGDVRRNRSISDRPLNIAGQEFSHGLGMHAAAEVVFALDGRYSGFTAVVGIDQASEPGEAIFQVWVDGQKLFDSGPMRRGVAKPVAVALHGRKELRLVVDPSGGNDWDHADWGNAQMLVPGGNDGGLQVQAGQRKTATITPQPAVDNKLRMLLGTALLGTKDGMAFRVKVPNGPSRVWVWLGEGGAANSRQFDLTVEGTTLPSVGLLPASGWEKLGPIEVVVADGTIDVAATVLKGTPQLMGILVEQPTGAPAPVTPKP